MVPDGATDVKRVVICGAAGRDFHDFNVLYRNARDVEVVAFTATQIPGIHQRRFPASVAGDRYPDGIPIFAEAELGRICEEQGVDEVVFAYSDISTDHVMAVAAQALAHGASFVLPSPSSTMLSSSLPVISVCAVRTGCGKSQICRYISSRLREEGLRTGVIRHPMPYGNLADQTVQRFATPEDLDAAACTLEEREEYEPHLKAGGKVFAGMDYQRILHAAEAESDVILWDGGNNDHPFVRPDLNIVVVDALRPTDVAGHFPGHSVLLMADLVVVNKSNAATAEQLAALNETLARYVPGTPRIQGDSVVRLREAPALAGARVLVVEDGPTITHGGMPHGAGYAAVRQIAGVTVVDPRPFAAGSLVETFASYPHIGPVLPAMGYSEAQRSHLAETINNANVDFVVAGTPIDLAQALGLKTPVVRVFYDFEEPNGNELMDRVRQTLSERE